MATIPEPNPDSPPVGPDDVPGQIDPDTAPASARASGTGTVDGHAS